MSNLNPIQIDRYTLYLDRIVIVKISEADPTLYDVIFRNGSKLQILRQFKVELETKLPISFLRYDEAWVSDQFVLYMEITWDARKRAPFLLTVLEGYGRIKEYGSLEELQALRDARFDASSAAQINTSSEITTIVTDEIDSQVPPIVDQKVDQFNYAALFNNQLNQ